MKKNKSLIDFRESKRWTQEDLARAMGISVFTVYRWEAGKYKPSHLAMEKLKTLGFEA